MFSKKRKNTEIHAGSMADIAFLLLIFFLVSTSMDMDKGIQVLLPAWTTDTPPPDPFHDREVLEILVNGNDQVLLENELSSIDKVKEMVIKHLSNHGALPDFSTSPDEAIVSLQNHQETTYQTYLSVYNEIKAAYTHVRNEAAQKSFNLSYAQLNEEQQKQIREMYPMRLSEAHILVGQ